MMSNIIFIQHRVLLGLLLLFAFFNNATAQPLAEVRLEYQKEGIVATIQLTGPVQYLRHFPESHGKTLEIFYDRLLGAASSETWVDNEVRKSPPSNLIPSFTVTTRDQNTKPRLVIEFAREAEYSVAPGADKRSLLITIRPEKRPVRTGALPFLPTIMPEPKQAPAGTLSEAEEAAAENNKQARALMIQGRDALAAKNNESAVDAFNKLLLLPPNDYTQDAQEWVGVARERSGQIEKARIEYELYLRLYPEGEGAAQVAQRLAGLSGQAMETVAAEEEKKAGGRWMTYGSITSRYYFSHSKIATDYTFNNAVTTSTISLTDQSMLITSVDASERYVGEEFDGRLVFSDVYTKNFLVGQRSQNRMGSAYGEIKNRTKDYMLRVGRQTPTGGGVLGRFTGLYGSYGYGADMHFNAVAGALRDYSPGSQPSFAGASVDKGPFSLYYISQTVDSVADRRAVGTEWRYFEDNRSVFALLDYDTYFKAVNTAQVMGTTPGFGGTVNFLVDHRKTPSLSKRNALNGAGTSSIKDLLNIMTSSQLRDLAIARTATSNTGQIGVTLPWRAKWQVGGDIRMTNTSGMPASGTNTLVGILAETPTRGTEKAVTGQLIGSGLYREGDIWSGSLTINTSSAVNGYAVNLFNHNQYKNGWTMDTSLQLYRQKDQYEATTTRISPMVRGAYRLREQFYVDVDGGIEMANFKGAQTSSKTTRYFFSGGLRWDF